MKNTNYYWHQSEEKSSMLTQYAEGGGGGEFPLNGTQFSKCLRWYRGYGDSDY